MGISNGNPDRARNGQPSGAQTYRESAAPKSVVRHGPVPAAATAESFQARGVRAVLAGLAHAARLTAGPAVSKTRTGQASEDRTGALPGPTASGEKGDPSNDQRGAGPAAQIHLLAQEQAGE